MELLEKLNIPYKNAKLYEKALTHTSYANENNITFKDLILKYLIEEIEKENNAL